MTDQDIIAAAKNDLQSLNGIKNFVTKMLIFQHYAIQVLHIYGIEEIETFVNESIGHPPEDESFYLWYYKWYISPDDKESKTTLSPN